MYGRLFANLDQNASSLVHAAFTLTRATRAGMSAEVTVANTGR